MAACTVWELVEWTFGIACLLLAFLSNARVRAACWSSDLGSFTHMSFPGPDSLPRLYFGCSLPQEEEDLEDTESLAASYASVASGLASSLPSGIETPAEIDLRKTSEGACGWAGLETCVVCCKLVCAADRLAQQRQPAAVMFLAAW